MTRGLAAVLALAVVAGCGGAKKDEPNGSGASTTKDVALNFYFPVAVGASAQKLVETMVSDFNTANPHIKVNPTFAGNYQDTMNKVQTGLQSKTQPDVVVLQATDVFTLIDSDAVVPIDDFLKTDKDGQEYLADFLPAFMANSKVSGKTWSVPFQRSTPVMFYSKDAFKAANLDPEKPPKDWPELVSFGKKLTKADGSQWGLEIPSDGNPSWIFSAFFLQGGKKVANEAGTEVSFSAPEVVDGMNFIMGLSKTEKIMPPGVIKWGDVPNDLINGKAAMIYHTSGSIGTIKAKLDPSKFGLAFLPAGKQFGTPTGGGNLYVMKTDKDRQAAAWKFVRFMTESERVAKWSVDTGYIAARKTAWETNTLKDAIKAFPGYQVAKDQLQHAGPEIATHQNQQVLAAFGTQMQEVVTGQKEPKPAMEQAQKDADTILKPFKK